MTNNPNRSLLFVACACYAVSTYLVLYASTADVPIPKWGGYLDVGLVFVIVYLSFRIFEKGKSNPRFQTAHRAALNIMPLMLLGIWIYRNSLDLNILLPGLAWRTYLFFHILPYALNLWKPEPANE
ncbi:MAG: hypothetical protein AB1607_11010 [Chloroflexota bacterium]